MIYLYLFNFAMFQLIGLTLLAVWRRHRSQTQPQTFTRDMGYSSVCASFVSIGYYAFLHAPAPLAGLGLALAVAGAAPNLLFLASGVLRLAGRPLSRKAAIALVAVTIALMVLPPADVKLTSWPLFNMAVLIVLGVLATRWLWRGGAIERWLGPLLIALGLNQLVLVFFGADGLPANLFVASVLRVMIGCVSLLSALERVTGEIAKSAARFELMTEHSMQGVVVTDGERILYANPAVRNIYGMALGVGEHALIASLPPDSINAALLLQHYKQLQSHRTDLVRWEGLRRVAGGRALELRFEAWRVEWDGKPAIQLMITDDTERNASARELLYQARHDKLTGLPNRGVLIERLKHHCRLDQDSLPCALVVLNIDRFKLFNQSQGDVTGDQVLKAYAERLRQALGPSAELMRLGGDEFAIVDPGAIDLPAITGRLYEACTQALAVPGGGEYFIDASMGMAVFPDHAGNVESLLRAANAAMVQAKRMPGTSLKMAERRFVQQSSKELENEQALRKGIRGQEIYLDYQPKIDAASGKLLGFEALARWQRPGVGLVSPVEFIAIAERTGLIVELGALLLEQACRQVGAWHREIGGCVPVAVNVSPLQLLNRGFLQLVEQAVRQGGVPPRCLSLEITESAAVDNLDETREQLLRLRELGIDVAMDDFGTGFSSLSMLSRLPLSTLKIDRGLIDPLPAPNAVAVVTAICQLAAALELDVVAEGIETREQAEAARDAGCHELQGYYYGRPLAADAAGVLLRRARELAASAASADDVDATAGLLPG